MAEKQFGSIVENIFRFIFISIGVIHFIPSAFIDLIQIRSYLNAAFLFLCLIIIISGFFNFKKVGRFCLFEKSLAIVCLLITVFLALYNHSEGSFYIEGYKFAVIFLLIFFGAETYGEMSASKIFSDFTYLFSFYSILLVFILIYSGQEDLIRPIGPGGLYTRLDFTGSVTTMCVSAAIAMLLGINNFFGRSSVFHKLFFLVTILSSGYLILLGASRQVLLILIVFMAIKFLSGNWLSKKMLDVRMKIIALASISFVAFALFTIFVNDSFYIRIFDNPSGNYTSGRLYSMNLWFEEKQQHGDFLGFGYIRNNIIQEMELLFPHDEFIRFFLEGGKLGLFLPFALLIYSTIILKISIYNGADSNVKDIIAVIYSIILVETNLDNFYHNIFFSTLLLSILSLAGHYSLKQNSAIQNRKNLTIP